MTTLRDIERMSNAEISALPDATLATVLTEAKIEHVQARWLMGLILDEQAQRRNTKKMGGNDAHTDR
jgi:hypothetical protein